MNGEKRQPEGRVWISRVLIGAVLVMNVQCALQFLANAEAYLAAYELEGVPGAAAIRALGVLFLMWSVPYLVAFWDPLEHRVSLYEAVAMQAIGLAGETLILLGLPEGHEALRGSIARFILFDGLGLVALIAAAWITVEPRRMLRFSSNHRDTELTEF